LAASTTESGDVAKVAPPGPPQPPTGAFGNMAGLTGDPNAKAFGEIGVSGLKVFSGYLSEEYLPELRGPNAWRVYRQMAEGDATVCATLTAITLILRAVDWRVEPADDSGEAEKEAEFVESLLDDMSHPFPDVIGEVMSMLTFGWSVLEIVLKRRMGPDQKDPALRSKFDDGRIGVRKLPIRSQDSLLRWEMQQDGGIAGMWQLPPIGGQLLFIPIERLLLFRTTSRKNSPEGVSILRSAYKSWYLRKTIEEIEAIGIERELAGLPVVSIPAKYLLSDASATDKAVLEQYKKVARDVKFNQQGGIVIPSDCWPDPQTGAPSAQRIVDVKLLSTGGRRAIDTGPVVERHEKNIARSALADFMMLGDQKGSYALSKNKSELFLRACEAYLNQIAEVLNRFLLPRIWSYNNIDRALMPELKPGRVAPVDLAEFGAYLQALATAGAPLFPNQELSEYVAEIADMPAPPEDAGLQPQLGPNGVAEQTGNDDGMGVSQNPAEINPQQATQNAGPYFQQDGSGQSEATTKANQLHGPKGTEQGGQFIGQDTVLTALTSKLGAAEKDALQVYSGGEFEDINAHFREGDAVGPRLSGIISKIDSAFKGSALPSDIVVYRAIDAEGWAAMQRSIGAGGVLMDKSYTSTSLSRKAMESFSSTMHRSGGAMALEIRVPKGTRAIYMPSLSEHPEEKELLLNRGTKYRVVSKTPRKIVMEVIH